MAGLIDIGLGLRRWQVADRAEMGLLLIWCPAILAVLALVLARETRIRRAAGYAAMLATAAVGELVMLNGAVLPVLRALTVCAGVALLMELVVRAGMAIHGRGVAMVGLAILLAIPGGGGWYAQAAAGDSAQATGQRIALLSGVPLRWAGGADLLAGPADAWRMLAAAFVMEPADDPAALATSRWLLVQPRPPAAAALVAIDARIRAGARAVILTDPDLRWRSAYPPGDAAAPPRSGTLAPLLLHWGLVLERGDGGTVARDLMRDGRRWRLWLAGAGRFVPARGERRYDRRDNRRACRVSAEGLIADCRVGRGRAVMVADADLLDPMLWTDGDGGWQPAWRRSDNAAFVAALIAGLDGLAPPARPVAWRSGAAVGGARPSISVRRDLTETLVQKFAK
ncbi:hypothetical protein [Sphingomonas montana]|uniref:hypothetical protein n=1 Tax=Sphingomonas montana TaxID=1843236 RepID=UPI00096C3000|nr:hypothetical protein [Sphingomonas montana]